MPFDLAPGINLGGSLLIWALGLWLIYKIATSPLPPDDRPPRGPREPNP